MWTKYDMLIKLNACSFGVYFIKTIPVQNAVNSARKVIVHFKASMFRKSKA